MRIIFLLSTLLPLTVFANLKTLCEKVSRWQPPAAGPEKSLYQGEMNWISYSEAKQRVPDKNFLLVDTRTEKEFKKGKLPHAVHAQFAVLPKEASDFETVTTFIGKISAQTPNSPTPSNFQDFTYYLYCNGANCSRGARAGCRLREWGVPAKNVFLVNEAYVDIPNS